MDHKFLTILPDYHLCTVVIDAYPNTAMVEQGTTLVLVCRVVGVPSTTVLSYQWTCPGGSCDAGAVDPEWAARIQQGNILVVNVRNGSDSGDYTCTVVAVREGTQPVGAGSYSLTVTCELCSCMDYEKWWYIIFLYSSVNYPTMVGFQPYLAFHLSMKAIKDCVCIMLEDPWVETSCPWLINSCVLLVSEFCY